MGWADVFDMFKSVFADLLQIFFTGSFNFGGKVSWPQARHRNWGRWQLTLKWSVLCSQVLLWVQNRLSPGCVTNLHTNVGEMLFFLLPYLLPFQRHLLKARHFLLLCEWHWRGAGAGLGVPGLLTGGCSSLVWAQASPCPASRAPAALALLLFKGSSGIVYFGCNQAWPINTELARIKLIKLSALFPLMPPFIHQKGNSRMNCQRSFALLSRFRRIKKLQRSPGAEASSGRGLVRALLASERSLWYWSVNNSLNIPSVKTFTHRKVSFSLQKKIQFPPPLCPKVPGSSIKGLS